CMPSSHHADRETFESIKSCLGQSLLRLHRHLQVHQQQVQSEESTYLKWQEKWSNRREQISHRLERIESQLDDLAQQSRPVIRLSLVGVPQDAAEMRGMFGNDRPWHD